ncbi:Nucleosomal histone H3-Lys79 methylase [Blastomyces dermatitidis]|uniref:Histone-lysine N-methyltransferase, H3 lysine-79 specific n=3 Tax=Blastomyces TaxID=229219 RepID=A0A179UZG3_BLAGS|nr:histone-lysine N-methyltransferase, H3 lysine-79 specific [Blastomyces gilchristii SLH14081]XP_045276889.1 histone-lysine N-methyltransferase, H3 lysine-79 specific [Blastomyces dermatitidis ER-3]EQL34557.1 histone-lysine N-methyltransferase, H3 lysine-79 specific [Blastomyces dermatitidis ATCC 26199]KMW69411.1 histone-lysine N-methyltransferase, H3 lysine-79 specific [Blastomyces dermatitidis ATCC 18188]EEQ90096.2 histone-lysine N-methyltransferase, H3 lysine-79 specific [Blastomyces dermat
MGFFDHLQKKGSIVIQPKRPQIRKVEAVTTPAKHAPSRAASVTSDFSASRPTPHSHAHPRRDRDRLLTSSRRSSSSIRASSIASDPTPSRHHEPTRRLKAKSVPRKRPSPVQRLSSSSDESDTDAAFFEVRKRAKVSASAGPDKERRVRSTAAFVENAGEQTVTIVNAADITSVDKPAEFIRAFEDGGDAGAAEPVTVRLQYPGASQGEKYQLVVPREKEGFKPLDDIVHLVNIVSQNYIPEEYAHLFNDEATGINRRFRRALAHASQSEFMEAIDEYNNTITRLRADGSIAKHLDTIHSLPLPLVERILNQIYARTVSPRVESLRRYENGTDNVYGELLPRFISEIFKQTKLKSNQVFVDLGSGVGNVVLQAALEIGCESWGCEMMQNACDLAELQGREFEARCRLWGLAPGTVRLIRGCFLSQESIIKALQRADVVLINNQAFTPELNNSIINHFLDMKEGCQIVSLKSFVPAGHRIQARNLNSPVNLLSVRQKDYWSDSVSWTHAGGTYFIATKDSSRLKAFAEGMLNE